MHPAHLAIGAAHAKNRLEAGHGQKGVPLRRTQARHVFVQDLTVEHAGVVQHLLHTQAIEAFDGVAHVHKVHAAIEFTHHLEQHAVGQVAPKQRQTPLALAQASLRLLHSGERRPYARIKNGLVQQRVRQNPQTVRQRPSDGRMPTQQAHHQLAPQKGHGRPGKHSFAPARTPVEPHCGCAQRHHEH